MALQTIVIDPDAAPELTPDEVVAKINAATDDITRAGSVDPSARPIEVGEIGTTELSDGAVTNAKADSTLAKDNLNAMGDTDREYVKTSPTSGEFKIVSVQRNDTGKIEVTYDDVPVA